MNVTKGQKMKYARIPCSCIRIGKILSMVDIRQQLVRNMEYDRMLIRETKSPMRVLYDFHFERSGNHKMIEMEERVRYAISV